MHHKNYLSNPVFTLSEVLFTQSVRNKWKAPFRWWDSGGLRHPLFVTFPKPTVRQARPPFTATGKVCIWVRNWQSSAFLLPPLSLFTAESHCLCSLWSQRRVEGEVSESASSLDQQRHTVPAALLAQVTQISEYKYLYATCNCNSFSVAFLAPCYFYFVYPITMTTSILPCLKGKSL